MPRWPAQSRWSWSRWIGSRRTRLPASSLLALGVLLGLCAPLAADDLEDAQALFYSGRYAECIRAAAKRIDDSSWEESWWLLKIQAELETGWYSDALVTLKGGLARFPTGIRLRLLGHRVYLLNNLPAEARKVLDEIEALTSQDAWRYTDAANLVALGRFFLLRGADARVVLETFYDEVRNSNPEYAETYLATGELGLQKHDSALAADAFRQAARLRPADPEPHFGLARALADSDPEETAKALARAMELNPRHAGSLLMVADRLIDVEEYDQARDALDHVLAVNSRHGEAWAYRAVLAHMEGDPAAEELWRRVALRYWQTNPAIDHLIGRKLSQKYRFAEGAAHQRRALEFDPSYLPAKLALSQDLLRLGDEDGWRLADEVYQEDPYNVVAYNLAVLRDTLKPFQTLEADGFRLRMDAHEAEVYGQSVLELLGRAKRELCAKYGMQLSEPVVVEIFPEQKDFAIRTFGLPGGEGFLGVCFGNVITANSAAAQGANPSNWKAVLWHEFCHAVTLHKTSNKMPRWLSEGISVYEERQADPSWGQSMTAQFRNLVLEGDLTPVSRLSNVFLNPPTPAHLQLAYYEASLVVEYLIDAYGLETLKGILTDLALDIPIEDVLQRRVGPPDRFDKDFAEFARQRAEKYAPDADFQSPDLPLEVEADELLAWIAVHPNNIAGLQLLSRALMSQGLWKEAKAPLERLLALDPEEVGSDNAYLLLAKAHRELGEPEAERGTLERLAAQDGEALSVFLRLTDLCREAEDWAALATNAERALAVNPLLRAPHRDLARAAEALGDPGRAIASYRALLHMDPQDPAEAHFRLARLLQETGDLEEARRHVLMALEEAPRFRAALRTLLEIVDQTESPPATPAAPQTNPEQQP